MLRLRAVLAPVTAIWLLSQVGTAALVPVALWITSSAPHAAECSCGHDLGGACPMHHKAKSATCAMRAASSTDAAVLATLVGVTGVQGGATRSIQPAPSTYVAAADVR